MNKFGTFFLPGPTEVRPEVLNAMLQPMLPHRGLAFESLFAEIQEGLKYVFRTNRGVYVSSSSATGLMEAAIRCAKPGAILCLVNGAFSERFLHIANTCGRSTTAITGPWNSPVSLDLIEESLQRGTYSALTVVHSETSSGVLTELESLTQLAHAHDCAILVDSVSGVGGLPVETDAWKIDFVLTASQKALALPPGLAFGVASEQFINEAGQAHSRGFYFDLLKFEEYVHKNQTPNTPAISLLYAAAAQLKHIMAEGIENRWERHKAMSERTRRWVSELNDVTGHKFSVYSPPHASSATVTAVSVPSSINSKNIVEAVAQRGFVIGSSYGKLKDNTFRIGHMGDHSLGELESVLSVVTEAIMEISQ